MSESTRTPTPEPAAPAVLPPELRGEMWADLFTSELEAKSAQHHVTRRALAFVAVGLPLDEVLNALKVDAAGWAARVEAYELWRAANRAAVDRSSGVRS